jgi:hypothetical protein
MVILFHVPVQKLQYLIEISFPIRLVSIRFATARLSLIDGLKRSISLISAHIGHQTSMEQLMLRYTYISIMSDRVSQK